MFSIWINRIILSSLDGCSEPNADFLALVEVLLTYIWRWLAKGSSSFFYSSCGDRGLPKCHVYSLLGQTEGKRSFLKGAGKGDTGWDYPKLPLVVCETKKVSLFVKLQ